MCFTAYVLECIRGDAPALLCARWLERRAEIDEEVLGEVMTLLTALEQHGRDLEDDARDESHPIVERTNR